jgi:hypothetical protein
MPMKTMEEMVFISSNMGGARPDVKVKKAAAPRAVDSRPRGAPL